MKKKKVEKGFFVPTKIEVPKKIIRVCDDKWKRFLTRR